MLKYLWTVTQDLFVTVTLVTLMHALLERLYDKFGRRLHGIAIGASVIASAALAAVKGTTNKIVSSHWNHYIYAFTLAFILAFIILCLILGRREGARRGVGGTLLCLAGAGVSAAVIFYHLPGVMLYPFNFNTMGNGYLSSYYMVRLLGWLIALILLLAYSRLLYLCALHIRPVGVVSALLCAGTFIDAIYCFGRFFVPWVNRAKWLSWPVKYTKEAYGWIGDWMMFTANHAMLFIWAIVLLALAALAICFAQNTKVTEPWDNPAQRRKLRARNRHYRRMACAAVGALVVFAGFLTLVKGYDTRVIELSAPETYTVDEENIYVPLDAVNDFHLHRFEYRTENDVDVRWIVVRKPNSAAYGVGLDACDVCGNAGYYERNGQVVCRRCDVVMNINTIGFKGGCNPIPLSYEVGDGNLIFKLSDIVAGEREFK
ncbi:MAG: DUF2318 domain-containing protein [Clostridia bacterium]|nr:DUF2318 domain-containing protein [Clostridia bacterium]